MYGTARDCRKEHPWNTHVDSELQLSGDNLLQSRIGDSSTKKSVFARRLQLRLLWNGKHACRRNQSPESRSPVRGAMSDFTGFCVALRRTDVPLRRGRANQHRSDGSRGDPMIEPGVDDAPTAGGPHSFEHRSRHGLNYADRLPIGAEFLGHDHGQRGRDALPHFHPVEDEHDHTRLVDLDPPVCG